MASAAGKSDHTRKVSMVAGVTGREGDGFETAWNTAWSQAGPVPVLRLKLSTADAETSGQLPFGGCGGTCESVEESFGKSHVYAGAFLGCAFCLGSKRPYVTPANGNS